MHFDSRTQAALRDVGLDADEIRRASELVVEATAEEAAALESFFEGGGTVYSDMELAHSTGDVQSHEVDHFDVYTHAADIRGYLKFDSWGVPVEGGRVLSEGKVELTLGPTVHGRVRFAREADRL